MKGSPSAQAITQPLTQRMADAESVFNHCGLEIIVPDSLLELPSGDKDNSITAEDWLKQARAPGERKAAFFDERLEVFFVVKVGEKDVDPKQSSLEDKSVPPYLLAFLKHLQVALDATYIPPTKVNYRLSVPPRSSSTLAMPSPSSKGLGPPTTLAPPLTPSPKPQTNDQDKQYAFSEGTALKSFTWGEDAEANKDDAFRLLHSTSEKCWFAIYKLTLAVVFIRTDFNDPLLCLTASITLRDKPLSSTPPRRDLFQLIESISTLPPLVAPDESEGQPSKDSSEDAGEDYVGRIHLEEVNLLEGLPTHVLQGSSEDLCLPTTRLSKEARMSYCLPPLTPASPTVATPGPARSLPVLTKSFRRVLELASGFFVRMRTVILPQLVFPDDVRDGDNDLGDESSVVLSIEVENPSGSTSGFSVDSIEVFLRNEKTKVRLIGWGDRGLSNTESVFPLLIRPAEQFYLSYGVTFLRNLDNELLQNAGRDGFTKTVSFNIIGRPFAVPSNDFLDESTRNSITYLTAPFLSRWNCLLDLDPRRRNNMTFPDIQDPGPIAVPIPSSPFPVESPLSKQAQDRAAAVANTRTITSSGAKRHTYAGRTSPYMLTPQRPMSVQTSSFGTLTPSGSGSVRVPSPLGKLGMKPWTVTSPPASIHSGQLSPPLPAIPLQNQSPPQTATGPGYPFPSMPTTPAFPGYGGMPVTPRPNSVNPSFGQMGNVGIDMDAKRERTSLPGLPATPFFKPSTPRPDYDGPRPMSNAFDPFGNAWPKDFVVSISLIPPSRPERDDDTGPTDRFIHPLDEFAVEIFVFNQSHDIRTLSASFLDTRRRRDRSSPNQVAPQESWKSTAPPFMPLDCDVKIGPLRPSACQSVTMRFLAIAIGVHTIDNLVLKDIETGESINLRSVMDFAVLPIT